MTVLLEGFVREPRIACFSMEIALRSESPTHSGGLGVLACDTNDPADRELTDVIGRKMTPSTPGPNPRRATSAWIFIACGIWLIGLGIHFALLRPPLLPEDPRFMGSSLPQIQAALPGLERWLAHVFVVMGGFMAASGVLTVYVAATAVSARRPGTAIDSNFKWVLLVPALLWFTGLIRYGLEGASG